MLQAGSYDFCRLGKHNIIGQKGAKGGWLAIRKLLTGRVPSNRML